MSKQKTTKLIIKKKITPNIPNINPGKILLIKMNNPKPTINFIKNFK